MRACQQRPAGACVSGPLRHVGRRPHTNTSGACRLPETAMRKAKRKNKARAQASASMALRQGRLAGRQAATHRQALVPRQLIAGVACRAQAGGGIVAPVRPASHSILAGATGAGDALFGGVQHQAAEAACAATRIPLPARAHSWVGSLGHTLYGAGCQEGGQGGARHPWRPSPVHALGRLRPRALGRTLAQAPVVGLRL